MFQTAARARCLRKTFDGVIALDGVDLEVAVGRVHGVVGPNGAGKTTLLGILLGLATPDDGEVQILGETVARAHALPAGVAGFVDGPGLYPALTARANLHALARLRGDVGVDIGVDVDDALTQVGLSDVAQDRVRGFSLGMRQRLGLAAALLARPRLLVLDEPSNGLDPAGKRQVHRLLRRLAAEGTAIVLSSHRMDDVAELCDDLSVLAAGRVVFSGGLDDLPVEAETEHRLVTTAPSQTLALALNTPGLAVVDDGTPLVVRGPLEALDVLLTRVVAAGIGLRELSPAVAPLEAAYLRLTVPA